MSKQPKLPKGYRVTVKAEDGWWVGIVWRNGHYIDSTPCLHEFKSDARAAAEKLAREISAT